MAPVSAPRIQPPADLDVVRDSYDRVADNYVHMVATTGFGDITLPGPAGKLTSIVTMLIGISLFVRLAQAIFRPYKVDFTCPRCALSRHEPDAVHCKACGILLKIPDGDED